MSTPSFKYGNGVWATKSGSSLAYNDDNNNYKPLPFSVSRASSATRVNKQGLIEVVGNDRLRIDYSESTKGVALLEPSRVNLLTYSEALSNWTNIQNVTVTDDVAISPDGSQNASRINETTDNAVHRIFLNPTVANAQHAFSVFMKAGTRDWCYLRLDSQSSDRVWFNIREGYVGTTDSDLTASIEDYGNGWFRCTVVSQGVTFDTTPLGVIAITTGDNVQSYVGDVNEYIYAWGAQLEQGSYATSYIPTSGSTATRQADVANGAGVANVFNDSEGVLFADIAALANDSSERFISLSDGTVNNRVYIWYYAATNGLAFAVWNGGASQFFSTTTLSSDVDYNKLALKYKANDFSMWINGFEIATDTSGNTFGTGVLNKLGFDRGDGGLDFYGKAKAINVYQTALTDAELEYLTSYRSLAEMVTELNLNAL